MTREIPNYIAKTGIADAPITEDAGGDFAKVCNYGSKSKKFYELMRGQTCRANWALTSAMAEWVLWRCGTFEDFPDGFLYTEATWAGLIDYRYLNEWKAGIHTHPVDSVDRIYEKSHPQIRAMWESNYIVSHVYNDLADHLPAGNWINYEANLVRNVLPSNKKRLFTMWLKKVSVRLKELYPYVDSGADLRGEAFKKMKPILDGPPVPREVFDLDIDYTHDMADGYLSRFLEGLDHKSNPFLHSPEAMIKAGFQGTPYTWPAE